MFKKLINFSLLAIIFSAFLWQTIFQNKILFPADLLVGSYHPWLDYKWGTSTGVPVKNPYISDSFSQIFIWKQQVAESLSKFEIPLWNPFSYSGYPLLANFQSGVFNPFNFLLIMFGMVDGWNLLMLSGLLLSGYGMYLFLRSLDYSNTISIISSVSFALSGFNILWLPYANASFSLGFISFGLLFINKYFQTKKHKYLTFLSITIALLVFSGHFQLFFYGFFLELAYFLYHYIKSTKDKEIFQFYPFILGVLLSSIQIIPTAELSLNSIRFDDSFIKTVNYGLSPLVKLITLYAPDFFGNPSTYNYFGFFNYHETCFYVGILGLISIIYSLFSFNKSNQKFFIIASLICLLLGFDTIFGRLIYQINIPLISTSVAGRISGIFSLCSSILIAEFMSSIQKSKISSLIRPMLIITTISALSTILTFYFSHVQSPAISQANISFRNTIIPGVITSSYLILILIFRRSKFTILFLFPLLFDLFRFGWKNTPFVSKNYVYPNTPLIEEVLKDKDIFRIDRQSGPIMPPNTWAAYKLSSPSGYDPLSPKIYSTYYNVFLNGNSPDDLTATRYTQLYRFNPINLGKYNVKYLLVINDPNSTKNYDSYFNPKEWEFVKKDGKTELYKNPKYQPRAFIIDQKDSLLPADITLTNNNLTKISFDNSLDNAKLVLLDSYFPGWKAYLDGSLINIETYNKVFRAVDVPKGKHELVFKYDPLSYKIGYYISLISLALLIGIYIKNK